MKTYLIIASESARETREEGWKPGSEVKIFACHQCNERLWVQISSRDAVCVWGEGHLFAGLGGRRFVRLLWFSSLFSVLWNHLEVEALFYLFNQPTSLSLPDVELWNSGYFSQMCQSYFTRPWSNRVATVLGCGKGSEKQWLFHSLCGVQSLPSTDVWDWRRPSLILWKLDISLTLQWVHRCPTEWKSSWFQFVYSNAADFSRKH